MLSILHFLVFTLLLLFGYSSFFSGSALAPAPLPALHRPGIEAAVLHDSSLPFPLCSVYILKRTL